MLLLSQIQTVQSGRYDASAQDGLVNRAPEMHKIL
jgi:hypothetical protein